MKGKSLIIMTYIGLAVMFLAQMVNLTAAWYWSSHGIWPKALTSSLVFIFLGMINIGVLIIISIRRCCNKTEEIFQILKETKDK